jgi:hypothetical protein
MNKQYEREESAIDEAYLRGYIDLNERNRQMRELSRDYQAAAEEAAQDAYNREMERW